MDFIVADSSLNDIGYFPDDAYIDIDVGKDDDFQIQVTLEEYEKDPSLYADGNYFYSLGTEYGGILRNPEADTADSTYTLSGDTFRGMLKKKIIEPPSGSDYFIYSGKIKDFITKYVVKAFGEVFFYAQGTDASVSNFQLERYCTALEAIKSMCDAADSVLKIESALGDDGAVRCNLIIADKNDYSEYEDFSQDRLGIEFDLKKATNPYNHMICMGSGDLKERYILYLKINADNSVAKESSIPDGINVRVYAYDNNNVDDEASMLEDAAKKAEDINGTDSQEITIDTDMDLNIGDIVGGRDYITGETIAEEITQKIITLKNGVLSVQFKVGERS